MALAIFFSDITVAPLFRTACYLYVAPSRTQHAQHVSRGPRRPWRGGAGGQRRLEQLRQAVQGVAARHEDRADVSEVNAELLRECMGAASSMEDAPHGLAGAVLRDHATLLNSRFGVRTVSLPEVARMPLNLH